MRGYCIPFTERLRLREVLLGISVPALPRQPIQRFFKETAARNGICKCGTCWGRRVLVELTLDTIPSKPDPMEARQYAFVNPISPTKRFVVGPRTGAISRRSRGGLRLNASNQAALSV